MVTLCRYPAEFSGGRIGVVTPYKSQLSLLRSLCAQAFGSSVMAEIEFNTVDGFQGREVDILVLSTVRAAEPSAIHRLNSSSIGFVADVRRMNVALTRARLSLWIIGNARTLQTNENWAALLKDAKDRDLVIPVRRPYGSIFKSFSSKDPATEGPGNAIPGESEHGCQTIKDAVREHKRRVKNASYSLPTNAAISTIGKNNEDQSSKRTKSLVRGVSKDVSSSRRTRDKLISQQGSGGGNPDEKSRNNSEKMTGETQTKLKSTASKDCLESSKCKERKLTTVTGLRSSKGSLEVKDVRDVAKASNQVEMPKHTIVNRKQQRDAVDALLSSALISSRKPESSLKSLPVKRNLSSTSTEDCAIRLPKSRKGT